MHCTQVLQGNFSKLFACNIRMKFNVNPVFPKKKTFPDYAVSMSIELFKVELEYKVVFLY